MKRNVCLSVVVATVAVFSAVTACGGGDDKKGGSAREKCRDFVEAACEQFIGCGFAEDQDECDDALAKEGFDCDDAVDVGKNYDDCLDDIQDAQCGSEPEIPASCEDAITLEK